MSEPIQSIAQNNYILHNIDAKKLYVQEPLFTANSGDAVYVGWRPDETVLWSGSSSTSAFNITLNETGEGKLEIKELLDADDYEVNATYNGDSNYNSTVATSIVTIVVISKLTLTRSSNNLIINCKNDGSDVTGFNVSMRLYLASSTYIDISSTTDSNGNITVQNIIQSGRSYYAVYRNITSNTLTT